LTLKDRVMAKECRVPVLESIYRKRLQYPEMKDRDET
jgi:membrane-associated HD superfamily phosphohydrolase